MSFAKTIEISSESKTSFEDAVSSGIKKASATVDNIDAAWIKDQVVLVSEGKTRGYHVHMHVTFRLK